MNTAGKLTVFAAAVAVAFGGAMAVGAAVGPIDVGEDTAHDTAHDTGADTVQVLPRGLAVAQDGYRFAPDTTTIGAGAPSPFTFRILDDTGAAVTEFDVLHERQLHLIVLSRNLVDYAHLHPTLDEEGEWTVELPSLTPGSYRVFADFQPTGAGNLTLGTDLLAPGAIDAAAVPAPSTVSEVDGYTVTLSGTPRAGDSELSFNVELAGERVRTEPYLGAAGHLVAIRSGDLAYLHVHPHDGDDTADTVTFTAEFPTAGTYRLFFDFSHAGAVRTASFTVDVPNTDGTPTPTDPHDQGH
jgi:hypothetical protein